MLRRILYGFAAASVLLGLAHIGFGLVTHRQLSLGLMWFTGAGLAMVVGGLLNLAMLRIPPADGFARAIPLVSNLALTAFAVVLLSMLPAPQVALAALLFTGSLVGSVVSAFRRA